MPLPSIPPQAEANGSDVSELTPRQIVAELDRYVVGQADAKRMVAVAMRDRWRRNRVNGELRDEITPKNIIMIGPTGVGKTEVARRLARLAGAPFVKVEATKFTEVGYVGRDVESMIRDLMDRGVTMVKDEETARVRVAAEAAAEERLLDLLLPANPRQPRPAPHAGPSPQPVPDAQDSTREKLRDLFRQGKLDDREVELNVSVSGGPEVGVMAMPGMPGGEDMGMNIKDMLGNMFPKKRKKRRMKVHDAHKLLIDEEADKLIDMEAVTELARARVEEAGIVFIDELDKVCAKSSSGHSGPDVSREGVQRDLLPVVEGSSVSTKHGLVRTDHILFIAAGAFHLAKPSDLIPELQGRFPLRAELADLTAEDFFRILTEPDNALTAQYTALMATEGVELAFAEDGLREVASVAEEVNRSTENIGARRLATILERILAEVSFEAPDMDGVTITVDAAFVQQRLGDLVQDRDLSKYIL